MDAETTNSWVQQWIYPKSLYCVVCGLLKHLRVYKMFQEFSRRSCYRCGVFRKVLDISVKMKELSSRGLGWEVKSADPIYPEDKQNILDAYVIGMDSSLSLQITVFSVFAITEFF